MSKSSQSIKSILSNQNLKLVIKYRLRSKLELAKENSKSIKPNIEYLQLSMLRYRSLMTSRTY